MSGTGSRPLLPQGWQREMRDRASQQQDQPNQVGYKYPLKITPEPGDNSANCSLATLYYLTGRKALAKTAARKALEFMDLIDKKFSKIPRQCWPEFHSDAQNNSQRKMFNDILNSNEQSNSKTQEDMFDIKTTLIKELFEERFNQMKMPLYLEDKSIKVIMGSPEATIVTIVETYFILKIKNMAEKDIFDKIEEHRNKMFGHTSGVEHLMSKNMKLNEYIKYRIEKEYVSLKPQAGLTNEFIEEAIKRALAILMKYKDIYQDAVLWVFGMRLSQKGVGYK